MYSSIDITSIETLNTLSSDILYWGLGWTRTKYFPRHIWSRWPVVTPLKFHASFSVPKVTIKPYCVFHGHSKRTSELTHS